MSDQLTKQHHLDLFYAGQAYVEKGDCSRLDTLIREGSQALDEWDALPPEERDAAKNLIIQSKFGTYARLVKSDLGFQIHNNAHRLDTAIPENNTGLFERGLVFIFGFVAGATTVILQTIGIVPSIIGITLGCSIAGSITGYIAAAFVNSLEKEEADKLRYKEQQHQNKMVNDAIEFAVSPRPN